MVNHEPVITDLVRVFPQMAASPAWGNLADHDGQWCELAQLIRDQYQQGNYEGVQSVFDRLEKLLADGAPDVRAWVAGFLQTVQDVAGWDSGNADVFLRFLGQGTRCTWKTLNTIRFDLADCSILEAEILMWRVVHPTLPARVARR
jgi:hypothetical protein